MPDGRAQSLAIACSAGGFKGVFVHGVHSALEEAGVYADGYAAASSSVFPAVCAAIHQANEIGLRYWRSALHTLQQPGNGMSEVVLHSITESSQPLHNFLLQPDMARFFIATSAVVTAEGAEQTQGDGARRLGRRLLVSAARGDSSWARQHLRKHVFDSAATDAAYRLTPENIDAVIYASTRMLHAWTIPATIAGQAFVDASYTCACPAIEMAQEGYKTVIAIATEAGPLYRDIFASTQIPDRWGNTPIHIIRPAQDLAKLGTGFTEVTEDGLVVVYEHGKEQGRAFLQTFV
ncbi:MAG: hypothetical protein ABI396_03145 [Ktedonobacteraceae bacterium]